MTSLTAFTDQVDIYTKTVSDQLRSTYNRLTAPDAIRLIVIVGGYALLRPYLVKLGGRFQAKDHERVLHPEESSSMAATSSRSQRSSAQPLEDTDSESEEEGKKGTDWGKKARRRQRHKVRGALEIEEKRRKEEEEAASDRDIEDYLIEGENWLVEKITEREG
ncbi:hypothetical protein MMC13_001908 [Lambiella insularis]|nr:hypothetical protein [Lambiella insularis]